MHISSKAGTEIFKNEYQIIDSINGIPTLETDFSQLRHNHSEPLIMLSNAYEDKFIMIMKEQESVSESSRVRLTGVHSFIYDFSLDRIYEEYTQYFSLENALSMLFDDTEYSFEVKSDIYYYALDFQNFGDNDKISLLNQICDRWELEYHVTGNKVVFGQRRGRETTKQFRYKMNITDSSVNLDMSEGATYIRAYFGKEDEENPENSTYTEREMTHPLSEEFGIRHAEPYSNENITVEETMQRYMKMKIEETWKLSVEVDITDLIGDGQAEVGDTVWAIDERLNLEYKTRIIEIKRYYNKDDQIYRTEAVLGNKTFIEAVSDQEVTQSEMQDEVVRYTNQMIESLKADFDNDFNAARDEMRQLAQDAKDAALAEIQAAEQRMEGLITTTRNDWTDTFEAEVAEIYRKADEDYNRIETEITGVIDSTREEMEMEFNESVQNTRTYAEQQAQAKADAVQGNLESFEQTHQQLYDSVTSDIMDIDTFLGDKSTTLAQQFADVESDFSGLQTELNGVSEDLGVAKTNLQKQLDAARAEIDGIEVGGRNYFYTELGNTSERKTLQLEPETNYIMSTNLEQRNDGGAHIFFGLKDFVESTNANGVFVGKDVAVKTDDTGLVDIRFYQWRSDFLTNRGYWVQLEKGTIATDWTPAPEDTEAKITTLNEQIEFIEGELSAKLEQTDIEPINNKITEYGNTLTANAQSIQSLLDKTELHDGDITQWSNETKSNAESISQTLTRVEETEAGIGQAKTDIQTNADGIAGVIRDVETIDGNLSTLTTDFNIEAGKIETLISKTDGHDTQITNIVADYNSIEQTVARMDDDMITGFSNVDQRFDSITNTVANINTWHYNLLRGTRFDEGKWDPLYGEILADEDVPYFRFNPNSTTANAPYVITNEPYQFKAGETYTLSWDFQSFGVTVFNNIWLMATAEDGGGNIALHSSANHEDSDLRVFLGSEYRRYWIRFTPARDIEAYVRIGVNLANNPNGRSAFKLRLPYLTTTDRSQWLFHQLDNSQNMDEVVNRVSTVEQLAESIRLDVQEISGEYVKQSGVYVGSSGVQIGSTYLGDREFASIFRVSPRTIDAVAEQMRVSGDLYVKGEIQSFAMEAVEGEFGRLWADEFSAITIDVGDIQGITAEFERMYTLNANIERLVSQFVFADGVTALVGNFVDVNAGNIVTSGLSANVILSSHINSSNALIEKLFSTSARIDTLISKTHFVNEIKATSIDAVHADLRSVNSEIMTSNIIKSNWLDVDTALFERFTASEAFIDRLEVKAANIRDLNTIEINTNQLNITTLLNSMGEVEGGLTIRRPDGAIFVQNGLERFGHPIPVVRYLDDEVETDNKTYWTNSRGAKIVGIAYGDHAGRYYNLVVGMGLRWDSDYATQYCNVQIRTVNSPSGVNIPVFNKEITARRADGLQWHTLSVPLGRPTYGAMTFQIEIFRRGENVYAPVEMRYGRSWISA